MSKAGRPRHAPTDDQRRMVEAMAGFGVPSERIAQALGITMPTLRRHYRRELDNGAALVEGSMIGVLLKNAQQRSNLAVSQRAVEFALQMRFGWIKTVRVEAPTTAPRAGRTIEGDVIDQEDEADDEPMGKKEQADVDAQTAHEGTPWATIVSPGSTKPN